MALLAVVLIRIMLLFMGDAPTSGVPAILFMILLYFIIINVVLMLFNIIPVPPLDGHHVLEYFLPPSGQRVLAQIGPFGILIAIFLARPWLGWAMPRVMGALEWLIFFPNNFG